MEELIEEIKQVFENVPYPGNSNIGTDELIVTFHDMHWRQVPPHVLHLRAAEITSFSPEAFRFYLPAMMLGALLQHDETDTLSETLVYSLGKSEDENLSDSHWGRKLSRIIELLTPPEKKAVYNFLLKCRELCPEWAWSEYQEAEVEDAIRLWAMLNENSLSM